MLLSRLVARGLLVACAAASIAPVAPAAAQTSPSGRGAQPIQLRWLGHAGFEVVSAGGTRILIDPWLGQNPSIPDSLRSLDRYAGANRPAAILVTHSHSDHSGDAKALAQSSGAMLVSGYEWVQTLGLPDSQAVAANIGGTIKVGDVTVHVVPAIHSSEPGGRPIGFVLEFADGRTVYHTGDTWIFGDMALIQELYRPSILLLGVGGGPFTQPPTVAALAVRKYFRPTTIVPMHYGTFPVLATEEQVRSAFSGDRRLVVMRPGETRGF